MKLCLRGLAGLNIVQQGVPPRPNLPSPPSPGINPNQLKNSWNQPQNTQSYQFSKLFAVSPREPQQANRGPSLTPAQAKALSLSKTPTGPNVQVGAPRPNQGPVRSPSIQHRMQAPSPGQPASKMARSENMQGVSFSRPMGNTSSPAEELLEEEGSKEKSIRKEVEGLQTLELLDNLVNFLNDA